MQPMSHTSRMLSPSMYVAGALKGKTSMQHFRRHLLRGMHAAMPAVLAQHLYNGDCWDLTFGGSQ